MHPYATDSHERRNVIFGLAVISVALTYALHQGIARIGVQVPWWVEAPSVIGLFGILYKTFDRYLWRLKVLRCLRIVKVPDLAGEWDVQGITSFNGEPFRADGRINQTWTQISVVLDLEFSLSRSLSASLIIDQPEGATLSYEYRNDPKPHALPTMHSHRGTAVLRMRSANELEGEYYSGRDRQNYGSLTFRRKS